MTNIDEVQNLVNSACARITSLILLNEKAIERMQGEIQESASANQNTVDVPVVEPEKEPLTSQELYEKLKKPGEWEKFLAAKKPELEAGWGRRSA